MQSRIETGFDRELMSWFRLRKKEFWRGATNLALADLVENSPVTYSVNRVFDKILSLPEVYSRII